MIRQLRRTGRPVATHTHPPRRGLAEHRQSLLRRATARLVLFLDDDVWLEPGTVPAALGDVGVALWFRRLRDARSVLSGR
jgi:hypothetical protein